MSENPLKFDPATQKNRRTNRRCHGEVRERWVHCPTCKKMYNNIKTPHCVRTKPCRERKETERTTAMINTGSCYSGWYEHLGDTPVWIESKAHLYRECVQRGLQARTLMSGGEMKRPRGA